MTILPVVAAPLSPAPQRHARIDARDSPETARAASASRGRGSPLKSARASPRQHSWQASYATSYGLRGRIGSRAPNREGIAWRQWWGVRDDELLPELRSGRATSASGHTPAPAAHASAVPGVPAAVFLQKRSARPKEVNDEQVTVRGICPGHGAMWMQRPQPTATTAALPRSLARTQSVPAHGALSADGRSYDFWLRNPVNR